MDRFGDARDWFFERRFGLFVHWGLYAIHGWHEQEQFRRAIPRRDYVRLVERFDPARFDPDAWLSVAEAAGMSYLCFTTKHVDGFCLWDSALTEYKVTRTPYGRDVLGLLADACHRRGFPLCLYYSIADMHHPCYPNAGRSYELPAPDPGDTPDQEAYLRYVRAQVKELCTRYGTLHGFWWDANMLGHRDPSFNAEIRALQPQAVINGRGFDEGDFSTPERDWDRSVEELPVFQRPTEACQSLGVESWGYREEEDYYTDRHLMASIARTLAKGGNYLLNVGPRADGTFPPEAAEILGRLGRWYHRVKEALLAEPAPGVVENPRALFTRSGDTLYVHLHEPPASDSVLLKPLAVLPRRATLLNTGADVAVSLELLPNLFRDRRGTLRLRRLPANALAGTVPVVKLEFAPGVLPGRQEGNDENR